MTRNTLAAVLLATALLLAGCDQIGRMTSSDAEAENNPHFAKAKERYAMMDYQGAIEAYERALRQNANLAKAHLEIALIYDDKLKDHISAVYHFRKYLVMRPDSGKKELVEEFMENSMRQLMAQDSVVLSSEKAEIIRLKAENNSLRSQIASFRGQQESRTAKQATSAKPQPTPASAPTPVPPPPQQTAPQIVSTPAAAVATPPPSPSQTGTTYVVQNGDTLASISRKFYSTSGQWKKILDANPSLGKPENLKPGQSLVIPP
ncbi:LysM peptidoglycan-binding domain-containing protein [Oscillatoria amoena NRMC-F 0135]|nr:LysM peptidoglycan-binding domain-containing protein [Oscillatoria laete-virens]MDL5048662.1 LysM peptidoglycan-binding domain-containing protein [Oscillatoria amoena NRMC-F 0135]MDL5053245.1 LysM peptidoglycan-binding domain-containing protein [Oscillatoria laete-virens NRMC-F 0139]